MARYAEIVNSKPTLLTLVVIGVIGSLSVPVLIPHFDHGTHIYHLLLHTGGIILSVFLTLLGINAYYKMRTKKMENLTLMEMVAAILTATVMGTATLMALATALMEE